MEVKIAFVEANPTPTVLDILYRMAESEYLRGATISLASRDAEKLKVTSTVAEKFSEAYSSEFRVEAYSSVRSAIEDSDFVILALEEDFERWRLDYRIPHRYGVRQVGGRYSGPGGLARTLRVIPRILELCRDIEDLCRTALILDCTDPLGRTLYAISRYTKVKAVGIPYGVYGRRTMLSLILDRSVEFEAAGIDGFSWILDLRFEDGGEAYQGLREAVRRGVEAKVSPEALGSLHEPYNVEGLTIREPLSAKLYEAFGLYPSPSDNTVGEHLSFGWTLVPEEVRGENWIERMEESHIEAFKTGSAIASGRAEPREYRGSQLRSRPASVVEAVASGRRTFEYGVEVVNRGSIPGLPEDAVVEVPAVVDRSGVHPFRVEPLPEGVASLLRLHVDIQKLSVEAAYEGSYDKALQTLILDPVVPEVETAEKLLSDLLQANVEFLPQFKMIR